MNIIAKHDGQATVARREPQNWHAGASVELAAPQFGQLRVSACIAGILAVQSKCGLQQSRVRFLANIPKSNVQGPKSIRSKQTLDVARWTRDFRLLKE